MFTYKFVGLDKSDAPTPYYYGSLPAKPELGHILSYNDTGNRYAVVKIDGEGLVGDGDAEQRELAFAEISRGESVPTLWLRKFTEKETELWLQKATRKETKPRGRSWDPAEVKEYSQENRETRLSPSGRKKMFYIKGIGGYLCSTERLVMNQRKDAPASMNATALEYTTKAEADESLAKALKNFGDIPNQLKVVEE